MCRCGTVQGIEMKGEVGRALEVVALAARLSPDAASVQVWEGVGNPGVGDGEALSDLALIARLPLASRCHQPLHVHIRHIRQQLFFTLPVLLSFDRLCLVTYCRSPSLPPCSTPFCFSTARQQLSSLAADVFKLAAGEAAVISNGRLFMVHSPAKQVSAKQGGACHAVNAEVGRWAAAPWAHMISLLK